MEEIVAYLQEECELNESNKSQTECSTLIELASSEHNREKTRSKSLKVFQKITNDTESYEGSLVLNNFHGHGFYDVEKSLEKYFFDGWFYANKFEGYGQIFYKNGSSFQGLFKQHKRYGPGLLTYPNGSQDVGLWNGFQLVRLSSTVGSNVVQKIASSSMGRSKLLSFKYLIPVKDENSYYGLSLLKSLEANEEILGKIDELSNKNIRNINSLFFNKQLFDEEFYRGEDYTIQVSLDDTECDEDIKETDGCSDDGIRIEQLKRKIFEVETKLKPYITIKMDLLKKIQYCRECCVMKQESVSDIVEEICDKDSEPKDDGSFDTLKFLDFRMSRADAMPPVFEDVNYEEMMQTAQTSDEVNLEPCFCEDENKSRDLQYLEDQLSNIEQRAAFYQTIYDNLTQKLNRFLEKQKEKLTQETHQQTKSVCVEELYAWNNEELIMDMEKHCFKNKNLENEVNFDVRSLIFDGRKNFGQAGQQEALCREFLGACAKGNKKIVLQCLRNGVNPNVTDSNGNNAVFYAASQNQLEIIPILTNYGAKLDQINDEGVTPLSHTFLRYISVKNGVLTWEKAFLPVRNNFLKKTDMIEWYRKTSMSSLSSLLSKSSSIETGSLDLSNSRITFLLRRLSNLELQNENFLQKSKPESYIFDFSYKKNDISKEIKDHEQTIELKSIYLTLLALLEYGSDPNIGEVPYEVLFLSLYTENVDLVLEVLKCNANVQSTITENSLTCLHVVTSLDKTMENMKICQVLLKNKCDPNKRTSELHWREQKEYFTGNIPESVEIEDEGKNVLHLLSMRQDFQDDLYSYFPNMARLFIEFGVDYHAKYLGHTPLSLAVLVGNVKLASYFIKTNLFNPYEVLPYNTGNILTLYGLKRFENRLSMDKCKEMLRSLCEIDVNFLNPVDEAENALDFIEKGDEFYKVDDKTKSKQKQPKTKAESSGLKEFIKTLCRETIMKQIQTIATDVLYDFAEEGLLESEEISKILAEYLTPELVLSNLNDLLGFGKLDQERFEERTCLKLLEFVDVYKKITKIKIKKEKKGSKDKDSLTKENAMEELLCKANLPQKNIISSDKNLYVLKPGLDEISKYQVCFQCIKGREKDLQVCPRCQLVYFCSVQCNKANMKLKNLHTCNILFYDNAEFSFDNQALSELALTVKEQCIERLVAKREARFKMEEQKLLDLWKSDTYGTKILKVKALLKKNKDIRGVNWNLAGLQTFMGKEFEKNPVGFDFEGLDELQRRLSRAEHIQSLSTTNKGSQKSSGSEKFFSMDALTQKFKELESKKDLKKINVCRCEKPKKKPEKRYQHGFPKFSTDLKPEKLTKKFPDRQLEVKTMEKGFTVKRLRKIPSKLARFVETLALHFPDIDFAFDMLPYACCTDGQLYYKFCTDQFYRESYSFS
ncbi:uncharacterized protein LOC115888823 [Sitophilus oryzae]|uniref:Uncharacterized protein LOC115888823 n=1 Tax=Sitophilus oryzae TaxID=7048 RepID=A0A6J2YKI3_SITOR|nr:uncharacterized protein LOC115888823 [Sitophilus oryzae]